MFVIWRIVAFPRHHTNDELEQLSQRSHFRVARFGGLGSISQTPSLCVTSSQRRLGGSRPEDASLCVCGPEAATSSLLPHHDKEQCRAGPCSVHSTSNDQILLNHTSCDIKENEAPILQSHSHQNSTHPTCFHLSTNREQVSKVVTDIFSHTRSQA